MQLKNSFVLLTALTAGSAVARLHGHERRHAHHARHQDVDKRGVGDMVYATINGALVSWVNEWSGQATKAPAAPASPTTASSPDATIISVDATPTPEPTSGPSDTAPPSDWAFYPANGDYSREGFGGKSSSGGSGIFYKGNVGNPWGSNIIQVDGNKASKYRHIVKFEGSNEDPWTVVFWNKVGPDGKLTGWYGHSALKFTLEPGETRFVAFDEDSQGAWGAAKGENLPTDKVGGYACTWGEFDFGNTSNNGWSGWDVSAIQAQNAGLEVQGMRICDHKGGKCSAITKDAGKVTNAYTADLAGVDGIGGSLISGAVRLKVDLAYNE